MIVTRKKQEAMVAKYQEEEKKTTAEVCAFIDGLNAGILATLKIAFDNERVKL